MRAVSPNRLSRFHSLCSLRLSLSPSLSYSAGCFSPAHRHIQGPAYRLISRSRLENLLHGFSADWIKFVRGRDHGISTRSDRDPTHTHAHTHHSRFTRCWLNKHRRAKLKLRQTSPPISTLTQTSTPLQTERHGHQCSVSAERMSIP